MAILFGTQNNDMFSSVTYQPGQSLRRRTHPTKRKLEVSNDAPRKRPRPSLKPNDAAHSCATNQSPSTNGLSPYTETSDSSTSCSSSSSSNSTSDDSSSDSRSNSDSDSDSTSTSSSDDEAPPLRPPPTSSNNAKKSTQPTYVTFIFHCWKTVHQLGSLPQARTCPTWTWEGTDACAQRTPSEKASPRARVQGYSSSSRG